MIVRQVERQDYKPVLEMDRKVYPTNSPATSKIMSLWYKKNPEFGLIYTKNNKTVGICIAIPLNYYGWKELINGRLNESDIDENFIFDNSKDNELGIHIYHIEKLESSIKEFHKIVLEDLSKAVRKLKEENKKLKVIGLSALCVTKEGINLFEKLGFREHEYLSSEHILEKNGKRIVIEADSQKILDSKIKEGYTYLNRCKMEVVYSSEKSIIWGYL